MRSYLLSVFLIALALSLISILSPEGEKGGIAKHIRLLTSLLLVCVLVAPLDDLIRGLKEKAEEGITLPGLEDSLKEDYQNQMQQLLDDSSRNYFVQSLTRTLEEEFAIPTGQIRCRVSWSENGSTPIKVTVILSGNAIWKDPAPIEEYVTALLGCPCQTAIE